MMFVAVLLHDQYIIYVYVYIYIYSYIYIERERERESIPNIASYTSVHAEFISIVVSS